VAAHRKRPFWGQVREPGSASRSDLQRTPRSKPPRRAKGKAPNWRRDEAATAKPTTNRAPLPEHSNARTRSSRPVMPARDCGVALKQLGRRCQRRVEYVPATSFAEAIVRPRMTCTCCEASLKPEWPSRPGVRATLPVRSSGQHGLVRQIIAIPLPRTVSPRSNARDKVDPASCPTLTDI